MTAEGSTTTQPSPPPYPPIQSLRRSLTNRKIGGVAGGLGRYAGIDPLIFRILFVVLAVFGGSGVLLYALGWLLIPEEGQAESEGQRLLGGRSTRKAASIFAVVVVIIASLVVFGTALDTGPGMGGLGVLLVVGVVAALLLRGGRGPQAAQPTPYGPVPPPAPEPPTVGDYGQTAGTAYTATTPVQPPPPPYWATAPMPPPPPPAPRERSSLGRVTVSVALIVVGLMVGWNTIAEPADDFRGVAILGSALAVVAGGLLVGAFAGRARGLIVLGIVLALATSGAAAADDSLRGGIGERTWAPTTVAAAERGFRLGVGDARLDLTRLPAGSVADVEVRLGVGELQVMVPRDARVEVVAEMGAGDINLLDRPGRDGTDLHRSVAVEPIGPDSGTVIRVDAQVGLGNLEVTR